MKAPIRLRTRGVSYLVLCRRNEDSCTVLGEQWGAGGEELVRMLAQFFREARATWPDYFAVDDLVSLAEGYGLLSSDTRGLSLRWAQWAGEMVSHAVSQGRQRLAPSSSSSSSADSASLMQVAIGGQGDGGDDGDDPRRWDAWTRNEQFLEEFDESIRNRVLKLLRKLAQGKVKEMGRQQAVLGGVLTASLRAQDGEIGDHGEDLARQVADVIQEDIEREMGQGNTTWPLPRGGLGLL